MSVDSTELAQLVAEAEDIARSVNQRLTTAHLLLAAFTIPNRAQVLLRERGIDEDVLLGLMTRAPKEKEGVARDVLDKARDLASSCNISETDCCHLLIAITRSRDCLALDLLRQCGINLSTLRNTALSYYLGGHMPRRLANIERAPSEPSGASSIVSTPTSSQSHFGAASFSNLRNPPRQSIPAKSAGPEKRRTPSEFPPDSKSEQRPDFWHEPQTKAERDYRIEKAEPRAESYYSKIESKIEPLPISKSEWRCEPPAQQDSKVCKNTKSADSKYALSQKDFPWLVSLGRNLTELAARRQIDPVIGRDREIDEIIDILGKRRTNNPCLLGEPGVGKTAVVEGVASRLLELAEHGRSQRIIIELDMASVIAGTQLRGAFSEKLNGIKEEVRRAGGNVTVFIDEIHTLIGAGSTGDGPQDAANELKSALARGDFPCIGATTHDEYRKFIQQDPALERRFTPVVIREPSVSETETILAGIIARYEEHHGIRYEPEALKAASALAAKYVSDRFLPDKAISIIDLAGSRSRREGLSQVGAKEIAKIVSRLAGVPEERLLLSDSDRLLKLEPELSSRIISHQDAIKKVAGVVRRNYAGFSSRRPMGSFLFMGPTGVGKTELAKALADVLFGGQEALVRVDMTECSEAHGVARLLGAPPGYVGYGDAGQLTEPVRKRPSCVVLLDEIEKAHREVLMLMLQVLEEGRLTDGKGRHIDFSNTVVILTTNLGAEAFQKGGTAVGFGAAASGDADRHERAIQSVKRQLPAELWNRLDERLVFQPLKREEVSRVAQLILRDSSRRLRNEKAIGFEAGPEIIEYLLAQGGFDPALGARPMRHAVQRLIEAPVAEAILQRRFASGDLIEIELGSSGIALRKAKN